MVQFTLFKVAIHSSGQLASNQDQNPCYLPINSHILHTTIIIIRPEFGLYYSYFSLFVMEANLLTYLNHAQICDWNQPVLSKEGKVSCWRKQCGALVGFKLTHQLRVWNSNHWGQPHFMRQSSNTEINYTQRNKAESQNVHEI